MARTRLNIPRDIETMVLTQCQRRCCLCYFLTPFDGIKKGQIAHLNGKPNDNRLDNLVWLCLDHHDEFDSRTSQSKNFTANEIKHYRVKLVAKFQTGMGIGEGAGEAGILPRNASDTYRPWRVPSWHNSDRPELFAYRARNRIDGVCAIERIVLDDGRVVVACVAIPGNPGSSITNTVETICDQVCREFKIEPQKVVWLENYEYINPHEWLHVTFGSMPPAEWGEPAWTKVTPEMWGDLGLQPVLRLRSSHGELISKLRRIRRIN